MMFPRPAVVAVSIGAIVLAVVMPPVLTDTVATILIYAVAATALNLVVGSAGQLSLGHAALLGSGAYAAGWFATSVSAEALLTVPIAAVAGAIVGAAFGAPSLRVAGQFLALVTIGGGFIFGRVVSDVDALGAEQGLIDIPYMMIAGRTLSSGAHLWAAVVLFILTIWLSGNLTRSHLGRRLVAIKDNEIVAESSGVDVYKEKLFVFIISSMICAIAGALFAHKDGFISAASFDLDLSLMLMLSCIVGGLGRPLGGTIGVLLLMAPGLILPGADRWELAISGVIALAVLFLMPDGIAGRVRRGQGRSGVSDVGVALEGRTTSPRAPDLVVEAVGIEKSFVGVRALDGVSVRVRPGTIHALIGPNGSGKTTLIDCITGVVVPDAGTVLVGGVDLTGSRANRVAHAGVARTFQTTGHLPSLALIEAASLAIRPAPGSLRSLVGVNMSRYEGASASRAAVALAQVGLRVDMASSSRDLSYGQARRLELARAIASDPGCLILDEPSAGLDPVEVNFIADLLQTLRDAGISILLADHHMDLVLRIADEVSVLDHGMLIANGTPDQIRQDPLVRRAYLGAEVPQR